MLVLVSLDIYQLFITNIGIINIGLVLQNLDINLNLSGDLLVGEGDYVFLLHLIIIFDWVKILILKRNGCQSKVTKD